MIRRREAFCRGIDIVNERAGRIVSVLLFIMVIFVVLEVVLRYFFNRPTVWVWDINTMLGLTLAMIGGGYALLYAMHVMVDVVVVRFRPRTRAIIDVVTSMLFFFAIGMLLRFAIPEAWTSLLGNERLSTVLGPPLFPVRLIVIIGYILILLQGIAKLIRDLNIAHGTGGVQ